MTKREMDAMRARIGGLSRYAQGGCVFASVNRARGAQTQWERKVDPDGLLNPRERARRADAAMRAHMLSMNLKRAMAAQERRELRAMYGQRSA